MTMYGVFLLVASLLALLVAFIGMIARKAAENPRPRRHGEVGWGNDANAPFIGMASDGGASYGSHGGDCGSGGDAGGACH